MVTSPSPAKTASFAFGALTLLVLACSSDSRASQTALSPADQDIRGLVHIGELEGSGGFRRILVDDGYAYVCASGGLKVIDLRVPQSPTVIETVATAGFALGVALHESHAYVVDSDHDENATFTVVDITSPEAPDIVGSLPIPGMAWSVDVQGDYAYVASGDAGLQVVRISAPAAPALAGSLAVPEGYAVGVAAHGNYVYLSSEPGQPNTASFNVVDVTNPEEPVLIASVSLAGAGPGLVIREPYAYVAGGSSGVLIINIENPEAPRLVGSKETYSDVYDIAIQGSYAYAADINGGLVIVDISDSLTPYVLFTAGVFRTYGVAVVGEHVYVACQGGVEVFKTLSGSPN